MEYLIQLFFSETWKQFKKAYFEMNFRKSKIYFWKLCLCDVCNAYKVYFLHPPRSDTQQVKPLETAVSNAVATPLIKYHMFLILRTHLKKHIYDCQIILNNSFSIKYALHVECAIWEELRQKKNLFYRSLKIWLMGSLKT